MGEVVPARLADPTSSPIPSHCASIVMTSTLRAKLTLKCILVILPEAWKSQRDIRMVSAPNYTELTFDFLIPVTFEKLLRKPIYCWCLKSHWLSWTHFEPLTYLRAHYLLMFEEQLTFLRAHCLLIFEEQLTFLRAHYLLIFEEQLTFQRAHYLLIFEEQLTFQGAHYLLIFEEQLTFQRAHYLLIFEEQLTFQREIIIYWCLKSCWPS